jgi:hypothetical protein
MNKTSLFAAQSLGLLLCAACGEADEQHLGHTQQAVSANEFGVVFGGCTEFAGIGLVPAANARPLVPASYTLASDSENAVVVVRVADCESVSVDAGPGRAGRVAQVGISVNAVDPSADINNYTLFFATDLGALHGKLTSLGVPSQLDAGLAYQFVGDGSGAGSLDVEVTPPQGPSYQISGSAYVPVLPPGPFVATWWADTDSASVQMRTDFPSIRFNFDADTTLNTACGSALSAVIGATSLTFPLLDSYNAFETAALEVTLQ